MSFLRRCSLTSEGNRRRSGSDTVGETTSGRAYERLSRKGRRKVSRTGWCVERIPISGWSLERASAPRGPGVGELGAPSLTGGFCAPGGLC